MSNETTEYTFEQKERLARRISKFKKQKYHQDIEKIITKFNPELDITTNPHGKFMYFHDLKKETYYALEKYVKKILKFKTLSETSDTQYASEIIKYSEDDDPFSNNPKLRYSNKERNIIKRKIYDNQINNEKSDYVNEIDHLRSNTEDDNDVDLEKQNSQIITESANIILAQEKISQNNVFVKRKTTKTPNITTLIDLDN